MVGISAGGRLSTTNQPRSSRHLAAVLRPAPDMPEMITSSGMAALSASAGRARVHLCTVSRRVPARRALCSSFLLAGLAAARPVGAPSSSMISPVAVFTAGAAGAAAGQRRGDRLGGLAADARHLADLLDRRRAQPLQRAEVLEQRLPAGRRRARARRPAAPAFIDLARLLRW